MGLVPVVTGSPFVTCLCLTRNRREWLPRAIECFLKSTYPNRELLILASGESVFGMLELTLDSVPLIRVVNIEDGQKLGDVRNLGVQLSHGELIAHWDDDDFSAPGRLTDQVERLQKSGKSVTGYSSMVFESKTERWIFEAHSNFAIGTSLLYRRSWAMDHPFESLQVGEDRVFSNKARDANQLFTVPDKGLMVASIHAGNTSPRSLKGDNWRRLPAETYEHA